MNTKNSIKAIIWRAQTAERVKQILYPSRSKKKNNIMHSFQKLPKKHYSVKHFSQ